MADAAAKRLLDKVALVIGGGSSADGFGWSNGQACALTFARHGAKVVVADIVADAAEKTAQEIRGEGGTAVSLKVDATRSADVAAAVDQTVATYGRLDILHNNVGIEYLGGPVETPEDAWDRVHATNLKSVFLACKYTLPVMERQGGGAIVNISSTSSLRWSGNSFLAYNSSKAALNQVTRIVARQYAPKNIRCNAVAPGFMDTPHVRTMYAGLSPEEFDKVMKQRDAKCPMGHQGTCWDVANAALFLASDEAAYITGNILVVDGGWTI